MSKTKTTLEKLKAHLNQELVNIVLDNVSKHPTIAIYVDKNDDNIKRYGSQDVLGLIPQFALTTDGVMVEGTSPIQNLEDNYIHLMKQEMGGIGNGNLVIDDGFNWHYDRDPILTPIAYFVSDNEAFIFYRGDMIFAINADGTEFWSRVD
jgi:hypothetical protein